LVAVALFLLGRVKDLSAPRVLGSREFWYGDFNSSQYETARNSQTQSETVRNSQKQPDTVRNSQKQSERARNSQKQPETVINSQKQPETARNSQKQGSQCTYNVTLRGVRATIVTVEK
jgi:hypothetical protein